jgi:hypothetical protein
MVLASALLVFVAAGCWPQEGFDAARSGFNPFETALTATNVSGLSRVWAKNAGATASTPIVVGSRVFVGAGDAVEAFDTNTGGADWVTHNNDLASSGFTGSVGPLTAVGGGVLGPVSWGIAGGLFTFDDATGARSGGVQIHFSVVGSVVERSDAEAQVDFVFGSGGPFITELGYAGHTAILSTSGGPAVTSPTLVGRYVLVGVANMLEAFSLDTCVPYPPPEQNYCTPQWSLTLPAAPRDPVGIGSTSAAIGLANGDVEVVDVASGSLQWTAHTGATAATEPAVANGQLYVGGADGRLYAFASAGCGHPTCLPEWSGATATGASISSQPAIAGNVTYVGTSTGRVYAFAASGCHASSCPALWNGRVDASATPGAVQGPVVSDGTLYASAGATLAAFRVAK